MLAVLHDQGIQGQDKVLLLQQVRMENINIFQIKFPDWCIERPWYDVIIFYNLYGTILKDLFVTSRQNRHKMMCGLHAYNKLHENSSENESWRQKTPSRLFHNRYSSVSDY